MTQGTPFRFVRDAALGARPGTPFRFVREAALTARPGTPFRWIRGTPVIIKLELDPIEKAAGRPYGSTVISVVKLAEVVGMDVTSAGQIGVYIAGPVQTTVITAATVTCTAASGVTTPATASIITGGLPIFPPQLMAGLDAVGKVWSWPLGVGASKQVQPGASAYFVVNVEAAAAAQSVDIKVYGYEL